MAKPNPRRGAENSGSAIHDSPYYYTIDRMYNPLHVCQGYNVRSVVDRGGAIVERYAYDPYGRPLIRESAGRGDMDDDTDMDGTDLTRMTAASAGTIWDARADLDDDGDVDNADRTQYTTKKANWPPQSNPTVAQAFSDVGNPFMFQGRPHFAFDTQADATQPVSWLNDHRNRKTDPRGRWMSRDPLEYNKPLLTGMRSRLQTRRVDVNENVGLFGFLRENPVNNFDPTGTSSIGEHIREAVFRLFPFAQCCYDDIQDAWSYDIHLADGHLVGWGYIHCVGHCAMMKSPHCLGRFGSEAVGIGTELYQIYLCLATQDVDECRSAWQASDWWDNELGRSCASSGLSCGDCCADRMGGKWVWDIPEGGANSDTRPYGPFADPPGPWSPPGGTSFPGDWGPEGHDPPPDWPTPPGWWPWDAWLPDWPPNPQG